MRLTAYSYQNSQREDISVLSADPSEDQYNDVWYVPRPLLLHMFIHLMPLKVALTESTLGVS